MQTLIRVDRQPAWDALCPEWKLKPLPLPEYQIELTASKAVCAAGEHASVAVRILRRGVPAADLPLKAVLTRDFHEPESFELRSTESGTAVPVVLERPGFARLHVSGPGVESALGIGFSPERIVPAPEPDGFFSFWEGQKRVLASVPPKVLRREPMRLADPSYSGVSCWDVEVACAGRAPVTGILSMPEHASAGSLPAYVFFHGAGVRPAFQPLPWARNGFLAFNVNPHGLPNRAGDDFYRNAVSELDGYPLWTETDPEKFLFRDMTLRVLRALEYMKSLPEWNGRILVVHGGSQGGYQSLAAAGLDHDVTLAVVNAPAMCDLGGGLAGRTPPWPRTVYPGQDAARTKVSLLCDGASFARHAVCEGIFTVGYSDPAATPSSVYAACHAFGGPKSILPFPDLGHELGVFWVGEAEILAHAKR